MEETPATVAAAVSSQTPTELRREAILSPSLRFQALRPRHPHSRWSCSKHWSADRIVVARQPSRSTAYCTSIRSGGQSECPVFTVCTLTKCTAEFNGTTTGTTLALRFYQISPTARGANSPFTCVAVPCLKTGERPRPAAEFQKIIDNLGISSSRTRSCSAGGSTEYARRLPNASAARPSRSVRSAY